MVETLTQTVSRAARTASMLFLGTALLLGVGSAHAQSEFAPGVQFTEEAVISGLPSATSVAFTPDASKVFVAVKDGVVRVWNNETKTLLSTPFIDITAVTNRRTDRGIGGIAVDPEFPTRPYVYIFHTYDPPELPLDSEAPRASRLIRVEATAASGYTVGNPSTIQVILGKNSLAQHLAAQRADGADIIPEPASCMTGLTMDGTPIEDCLATDELSHSAGELRFAPDGTLFASHGDGSSYRKTTRTSLRAQNIDTLQGKILHIDPRTGFGVPSNPFYDPAKPGSNRSKVWTYGMRNPFRFALNPDTLQVFVGDVGSSTWEEVNRGKGSNFGWPCFEGGTVEGDTIGSGNTVSAPSPSFQNFSRTRDFCRPLPLASVTPPLFSYKHPVDAQGSSLGASVTGLAFYSGEIYPPEFRGSLFIADYAQRTIRYLTFNEAGRPTVHDFVKELSASRGVVQLLSGPDSNIYALYLDLVTRTSELRRFRFAGTNAPPRVVVAADPKLGLIPLDVNFRSDGTSDSDGQALSYLWNFGDGTTSTLPHPSHRYRTVGTFEATLTVTEQTAPFQSAMASVVIRTGVNPPKARIVTPSEGAQFRIGDRVAFQGTAQFDSDEPVSYSWSILEHHNDHSHLVDEVSGASGSFVTRQHADNVRYQLCLFADAGPEGKDQTCRDIFPFTTAVTFDSAPPGATITYVDEGVDVLAPYVAHPIRNSERTIFAAPIHAGRTFIGWDDAVAAAERTFLVTDTPARYRALYTNLLPSATFGFAAAAEPLAVRFDASGSTDPEGEPLTFGWEFGDGSEGSGGVIVHAFPAPGRYVVRLAVQDTVGGVGTRELEVTVGMNPTPSPVETAASGEPSATPAPDPSSPAPTVPPPGETPTPIPVPTPVPPIAPKVKAVAIASTSKCGTLRTPCSVPPGRFTGQGTLANQLTVSGLTVRVVLERQVGAVWKPVASKIAKSTAKRRKLEFTAVLKRPRKKGIYRLSIVTAIGDGPFTSSRYRYLRVG